MDVLRKGLGEAGHENISFLQSLNKVQEEGAEGLWIVWIQAWRGRAESSSARELAIDEQKSLRELYNLL